MCLVRGELPVGLPYFLESFPEPETLVAGAEQRVYGHAEDLIPDCSPTRERRFPSHGFDKTGPRIEYQAIHDNDQHHSDDQVDRHRRSG